MSSKPTRVGGHVDTEAVEARIGRVPRVGETFEAEGLRLCVVSRTMGIAALDASDEDEDGPYDWLYVCTAEPVEDIEAAIFRIRETFGLDEADWPPDLEPEVVHEIEDILRAA